MSDHLSFITYHLCFMVLYNMTIKIEQVVHDDWLSWMQQTLIPAYLNTGLFLEYKFCRIMGDVDEYGITYALQFVSKDEKTFQVYRQLHAGRLQQLQAERYPDQYVTFRTLMEIVGQSR